MGYTHYWTHRRRFTNAEWEEVMTDLNLIATKAREEGISLGDASGETTIFELTDENKVVYFNGVGDDSHETFCLYQNRRPDEGFGKKGWDFCKTARKPYDIVVTAVLCYLESCWDNRFEVSSDGDAEDWTAGLELARRALPTKTNILDLPFDLRWERQFQPGGLYGVNYELRVMTNGQLAVVKNYTVLAMCKRENTDEIIQRVRANIPNSGRLGEIEKRTDRVIRNLLTQPELM